MGPTSEQEKAVSGLMKHHHGASFGTGVGSGCQGSGPGSGGQVQPPEIVEGCGSGGAASENKHGTALVVVNGRVAVSLADGNLDFLTNIFRACLQKPSMAI